MDKPRGLFMRNPDLVPAYLRPGMWGWLLHRVTGLLIVFYLLLHIWVIGRAAVSPQAFDAIMVTLGTPFWRVMEVGLLACVLYHGANGIRIAIVDMFMPHQWAISAQRNAVRWTIIITLILWVPAALYMLIRTFNPAFNLFT